MAILCTHCGKALPRDDAQFCNYCGAPVPFMAQSSSAPPAEQQSANRPPLREQIGLPASPYAPPRRPRREEPPQWLDQLDQGTRIRRPMREVSKEPQEQRIEKRPGPPEKSVQESREKGAPPPSADVRSGGQRSPQEARAKEPRPPEVPRPNLQSSTREATPEQLANPLEAARADRQRLSQEISAPTARVEESAPQAQADSPTRSPAQRPGSTMRELRVKVWEETETVSMPSEEKKPVASAPPPPVESVKEEKDGPSKHTSPKEEQGVAAKDDGVEDLPTRPLTASSSPASVAGYDLPVQRTSTPRPARDERSSRMEEMARLDTARMEAQQQSSPAPQPVVDHMQQQRWSLPPEEGARSRASFQGPPTPIPAMMHAPSTPPPAYAVQPTQRRPDTPAAPPAQAWQPSPAPYAEPPAPVRRSRSRKPLVIAPVLLCLLALGGVGTWIFLGQSSDSQKSVQAKQAFSDAGLGIALSYPGGWNTHVDHQRGNVSFYDSSHTAQVTIVTAPADGQDAGQYMQKEATGLGMTGLKPGAPVSFAGASWQQVQGTVQQKGATYSETLLVTMHGNHLFTIMQLAPQSVYA
ncbi:MAG: zinc-ribbon domain-containing protein, partial [Ktedonobacteraceae bacterium]|nr:zinc-ribbon domain-containing protein [Ktedonobacteraceae bacterium]